MRQSLKLGDFAFCVEKDGERRALPVLVERKKISDLVARSGAGDHMEQLRRMAAVPHAFLLLEGELWTATGYTAYGTGAGGSACGGSRRQRRRWTTSVSGAAPSATSAPAGVRTAIL